MNLSYLLLIAGLAIGGLNLRSPGPQTAPARQDTVTWPTEFEDRPLHRLPLSDIESAFARSFPGTLAHFQCGDAQVILRHVDRASRRLHSSATCLKAAGFQIDSRSTVTHHGSAWLTYRARRGSQVLHVREQIRPLHDSDATWRDVSQWFWHATVHADSGPWIAITVLSRVSLP